MIHHVKRQVLQMSVFHFYTLNKHVWNTFPITIMCNEVTPSYCTSCAHSFAAARAESCQQGDHNDESYEGYSSIIAPYAFGPMVLSGFVWYAAVC